MRKLIYHVASTVDGFIAHTDHSVDGFVGEGEHTSEYLAALQQDYDVVIMGRRTYEFGVKLGVTNPYPWLKQYVVSRSMERSLDPNVELVGEPIGDLVRRLKREPGKAIYLCGGGELAATLFAEHLVDELVVKLNPVLFGAGVGLVSGALTQTALELVDSKTYRNGVILLHYRVNH